MDEQTQIIKTHAQNVEALLFVEGGSLSISKICQILDIDSALFPDITKSLIEDLSGRGLNIIHTDTELQLVTNYESSTRLRQLYESSANQDMGDAGLEVLAIILYRGESSRATIDYIRGVNSSTTIRNLLLRGLIERSANKSDNREYLYRATTELLAHLGVTDVMHLPNYNTIIAELSNHEQIQSPFEHSEAHHGDE